MTDTDRRNRTSSFAGRAIYPAVPVGVMVVAATLLFDHSWRLGADWLHDLLATVSGVVLVFSIVFGPLVAYPLARSRGASGREGVLASFITPLAWYFKELYRMTGHLPFLQAVYGGLFQVYPMFFLGELGIIGLADIGYRIYRKKRCGEELKIVTLKPVLGIGAALTGVTLFFLWNGGTPWYMLYIRLYKLLFM